MNYIKIISLGLLLILVSCKANFQQLENNNNSYYLSSTEQLQDKNYNSQIEAFYNKGKEGTFLGKKNISIYYKIFKQEKNEKAAILISSGRTEAAIKYKELIYDLYKNGYSIYIHDHRGQGLSGRMIKNTDMGYIDNFQFYIDDMKYFYDKILKKDKHNKIFLLAHSMGGAIGMTYLEQNSKDFNAAAFSSPMLGLPSPSCAAVKLLEGKEIKYALGTGEYNDDKVAFKDNRLTGSELRYKRMVSAFEQEPKAKLGGATYQWVAKSCQQFKYINKNVEKIQTPFILFSAQNEQIVDTKAHQNFVEKAQKLGKDCKAYKVMDAQHELFIEKDAQRTETLNEIFSFFNKY